MRTQIALLMATVALAGCEKTLDVSWRCDSHQRSEAIGSDQDTGLGFTTDALADSLREGRALEVTYTGVRPVSGDVGSTFYVEFEGQASDAVRIDRTNTRVMAPGNCITGRLVRFPMDTRVSWTLDGHDVTLPEGHAVIEANGLADHRVLVNASFDVPFDEAPSPLRAQALATPLAEVDRITAHLFGRLNPHERMDYGHENPSGATVSAKDDLDNGDPWDGELILYGEWRTPDRDTDTP